MLAKTPASDLPKGETPEAIVSVTVFPEGKVALTIRDAEGDVAAVVLAPENVLSVMKAIGDMTKLSVQPGAPVGLSAIVPLADQG